MLHTFNGKYWGKKQNVNELVRFFSNSYSIREAYPFHLDMRV